MPGFASPWGGIRAILPSRAHVSMHCPYGTRHKHPQTTTATAAAATTTTTAATTTPGNCYYHYYYKNCYTSAFAVFLWICSRLLYICSLVLPVGSFCSLSRASAVFVLFCCTRFVTKLRHLRRLRSCAFGAGRPDLSTQFQIKGRFSTPSVLAICCVRFTGARGMATLGSLSCRCAIYTCRFGALFEQTGPSRCHQ